MYSSQLFQRSFDDTWNAVFGQSVWTVLISAAIFGSTLFWLRCRSHHEEVKTRLRDFGIAALFTAAAFVTVFLIYLVALTPAKLWREEHARAESASKAAAAAVTTQSTPFQLDVRSHGVDEESRQKLIEADKKIQALEGKLNEAEKTLASQRPKPRSLTEVQQKKLIELLKDTGSCKIALRRDPQNLETQAYSDQFEAIFKQVGWTIVDPVFLIHTKAEKGLRVLVHDGKHPPEQANKLIEALVLIGIPVTGMEVPPLSEDTFDLMIGYPEEASPPPSPTANPAASP